METTDPSVAYNLGCNQGNFDGSHSPPINSEVVLAFGGQQSNGSGTKFTNGTYASNAQIEADAENFAMGYDKCLGHDTSSVLDLGIGTNNSFYDVSYAGGQTWADVVASVRTWDSNNQLSNRVYAEGATDIEEWGLGMSLVGETTSWVNGYASIDPAPYLNFGSADGCSPQYYNNTSCADGWDQENYWYDSWGSPPALPTPEIYSNTLAQQWTMIALYGYYYQNKEVPQMQGPWDEHDLDSTTLTSAQAWDDFSTELDAYPQTAQTMPFSLEIHQEN